MDEEGDSRLATRRWLLKHADKIDLEADRLLAWVSTVREDAASGEKDAAVLRSRASDLRNLAAREV